MSRSLGNSCIHGSSSIFSSAPSIYSESQDTSLDLNSTTSTPGRFLLPPFQGKPIAWLQEQHQATKILSSAQKIEYYKLPCEFDYLGCDHFFQSGDFESWISHTTSHFGDIGPPPRAICTICDVGDTIFNWRERMFHIGNHLQHGSSKADMRRDPLVFAYILENGIITSQTPEQPRAKHRQVST